MTSRHSKSGEGKYRQLTKEQRLGIADYMVQHPQLMVKQVAAHFGVHPMRVYRIVNEFLDIKREYVFKATEKPSE